MARPIRIGKQALGRVNVSFGFTFICQLHDSGFVFDVFEIEIERCVFGLKGVFEGAATLVDCLDFGATEKAKRNELFECGDELLEAVFDGIDHDRFGNRRQPEFGMPTFDWP
jgi:hypothetical protein